jgi:hypothetical protein
MRSLKYFCISTLLLRNIFLSIGSSFLLIIFLVACSTEKKVVVPNVSMTALPGYVIKDTATISHHEFNVWLVTTETRFDSLFTSVITSSFKPNFDKEMAMAIRVETATASYKVSFKEMVLRGNTLGVYFRIRKELPADEDAGWVSLTTFPKNQSLKRVNFYYDDVLIRTIPVVIVY